MRGTIDMQRTSKTARVIAALFLILVVGGRAVRASADEPETTIKVGTIRGRVVDVQTQAAVEGAGVMILGTTRGAAGNETGDFEIESVPVGTYSLHVSRVGFRSRGVADVVVRPGRATFVTVKLQMTAIEADEVVVTADYFHQHVDNPTSVTEYTGEEIRRAPGAAGDVSRIVGALPSMAKVNDQVNSLIVRGGNPAENAFYLDDIEIPNINHFPVPGSTGGPIGLLNVDFIQDVTFSAGGFSAVYGDRLSSVMDLRFREGNRQEVDGRVDLNFAGASVALEGPLAGEKASWLFSLRRSYIDLLVGAIGTGIAPWWWDAQGKIVYDVSPENRITLLGVAGIDHVTFDREQAIEDANIVYGKYDGNVGAGGVNWRHLRGNRGYSSTSLSYLQYGSDNEFREVATADLLTLETNMDRAFQIRNVNLIRMRETDQLEVGFEGKLYNNSYNYVISPYTNSVGDSVPGFQLDTLITTPRVDVFASYSWRATDRLVTTFGLRYDYFEFNGNSHVSPRFSVSYKLSDRTTLNGATGIFTQYLPLLLLSQRPEFRDLRDPRAYHFILGVSQLLAEHTQLTVEGYYKDYENFPLDPAQPQFFIADEVAYRGFTGVSESLVDDGNAYSYGVEATLQKKLVEGIYGVLGGAFFRSRYQDLGGTWRDRVFDNRVVATVEGGWKPNRDWLFGIRWVYAGGWPYTPLNLERSTELDRSVLDTTQVNTSRYPAYHSMNLRVERRFNFSRSNLKVYLEVWNAYDQKNVATYYWNPIENKEDVQYQWGRIPVFGLEYEF